MRSAREKSFRSSSRFRARHPIDNARRAHEQKSTGQIREVLDSQSDEQLREAELDAAVANDEVELPDQVVRGAAAERLWRRAGDSSWTRGRTEVGELSADSGKGKTRASDRAGPTPRWCPPRPSRR